MPVTEKRSTKEDNLLRINNPLLLIFKPGVFQNVARLPTLKQLFQIKIPYSKVGNLYTKQQFEMHSLNPPSSGIVSNSLSSVSKQRIHGAHHTVVVDFFERIICDV
jgi:hypothetical protein